MDWISIVILVFFATYAFVCVLITLVGLPGTWLMVAGALAITLCNPLWSDSPIWGWVTIGIVLGLAVCGEIIETAAAGLGAKAGGGTKRGMVGAILGSLIGAFGGTFFIPLPLIGTLIGAIIGAFCGALVGELSHKEKGTTGELAKSATGAAIGRVMGIIGKTGVAAICFCVLLITAFF
ncbi:MAG: DUF456 domain-containing protein [Phycisphaerales bacterium]|jgi:hypothetical protein|nr:DUF456 domain-containing protein [Phycisphaerales bacterium]